MPIDLRTTNCGSSRYYNTAVYSCKNCGLNAERKDGKYLEFSNISAQVLRQSWTHSLTCFYSLLLTNNWCVQIFRASANQGMCAPLRLGTTSNSSAKSATQLQIWPRTVIKRPAWSAGSHQITLRSLRLANASAQKDSKPSRRTRLDRDSKSVICTKWSARSAPPINTRGKVTRLFGSVLPVPTQ